MATIEQRVRYIEGRLDSFATKSDLAELETRLIKWMIGTMFGTATIVSGLVVLIDRGFG